MPPVAANQLSFDCTARKRPSGVYSPCMATLSVEVHFSVPLQRSHRAQRSTSHPHRTACASDEVWHARGHPRVSVRRSFPRSSQSHAAIRVSVCSTRRTRPLAQVEFAGASSPTHVIEVLHVLASLLGSTMMANCFRRGGTTSQWWLKSACAHGRLLLGVPALHWGIVLSSGRESTHLSKTRKRRVFRFGWYRQILPLHP